VTVLRNVVPFTHNRLCPQTHARFVHAFTPRVLVMYAPLLLLQIVVVETVRAALKLWLLYNCRERHLIRGGQVEPAQPVLAGAAAGSANDDGDGAELSLESMLRGAGMPSAAPSASAAASRRTRYCAGRRTGIALPVPVGFPKEATFEGDLDAQASSTRLVGELLHIARPLVYVLTRYAEGREPERTANDFVPANLPSPPVLVVCCIPVFASVSCLSCLCCLCYLCLCAGCESRVRGDI
jgi:hypothetical protein